VHGSAAIPSEGKYTVSYILLRIISGFFIGYLVGIEDEEACPDMVFGDACPAMIFEEDEEEYLNT
jgi:hypothetical protein